MGYDGKGLKIGDRWKEEREKIGKKSFSDGVKTKSEFITKLSSMLQPATSPRWKKQKKIVRTPVR